MVNINELAPLSTSNAKPTRRTRHHPKAPSWMNNPITFERVWRVYNLWIEKKKVQEIALEVGVTIATVQSDIARAREQVQIHWQADNRVLTAEQVEAHRTIIAEAYVVLDELNEVIPNANRARAKADLLRLISEEETRIEELLVLAEKRPVGRPKDEQADSGPRNQIIIDIWNPNKPVTEIRQVQVIEAETPLLLEYEEDDADSVTEVEEAEIVEVQQE